MLKTSVTWNSLEAGHVPLVSVPPGEEGPSSRVMFHFNRVVLSWKGNPWLRSPRHKNSGNTEITYVGEGRGAYNKEVVTNNGGWRLRPMWYLCGCFLCFLPLFFITFWFWPRPVPSRDVPDKPLVDCYTGYYNGMWRETWDVDHAAWCCAEMGRGCPAHDEVPVPW